jgi:hypothetical protein
MRITLRPGLAMAGLLVAMALTAPLQAQVPSQPLIGLSWAPAANPTPPAPPAPAPVGATQQTTAVPAQPVQPILIIRRAQPQAPAVLPPIPPPVFVPTFTNLNVQTSVLVPDGGTALLASYSRYSEARSEFGPPILSKIPFVNRAVTNVSYGRSLNTVRATVSARVIDLREEEFRQTGYRGD